MKIIHGPTNVTYRDFASLRHYIMDDFGDVVLLKDDVLEQAIFFFHSVFIYHKDDIGC